MAGAVKSDEMSTVVKVETCDGSTRAGKRVSCLASGERFQGIQGIQGSSTRVMLLGWVSGRNGHLPVSRIPSEARNRNRKARAANQVPACDCRGVGVAAPFGICGRFSRSLGLWTSFCLDISVC